MKLVIQGEFTSDSSVNTQIRVYSCIFGESAVKHSLAFCWVDERQMEGVRVRKTMDFQLHVWECGCAGSALGPRGTTGGLVVSVDRVALWAGMWSL